MHVKHAPGPARARLAAALKELSGGKVGQVGWFESSKYPDGTSAAYIAAIHEFGYAPKNIPPRMGLRALIDSRREFYAKVAEQFAKQVLDGRSTATDGLEALGAVAEGDIRKQIASVTEPALKPSTLAERAHRLGIKPDALTGSGAKPLVEPKQKDGSPGGYLLATVTHIVGDSVIE